MVITSAVAHNAVCEVCHQVYDVSMWLLLLLSFLLLLLLLLQVLIDERGAAALSRLLEATPTLQQLELCRSDATYTAHTRRQKLEKLRVQNTL